MGDFLSVVSLAEAQHYTLDEMSVGWRSFVWSDIVRSSAVFVAAGVSTNVSKQQSSRSLQSVCNCNVFGVRLSVTEIGAV